MKILSMTRPRQGALNKLSRHNQKIQEHVIKAVVYSDIKPESMDHWIHDELCNWLHQADRVKCDSKLKPQDYRNTVFGMIGSTKGEALEDLEDFKEDFVDNSTKPYPEFTIDSKLIQRLYQAYQNLITLSIRQFTDSSVKSIDEWYDLIKGFFK